MNKTALDYYNNCPNCGGLLSDDGRCQFCGSKVYDFVNIELDKHGCPKNKTYLKFRKGNKIWIVPIRPSEFSIYLPHFNCGLGVSPILYGDNRLTTELDLRSYGTFNFDIVGDSISINEDVLNQEVNNE